MDLLSQALDVGFGEEAEDSHAGAAGVAIMSAVLSDDEAAVVVDADEVAGAHVFVRSLGDWLRVLELGDGSVVALQWRCAYYLPSYIHLDV